MNWKLNGKSLEGALRVLEMLGLKETSLKLGGLGLRSYQSIHFAPNVKEG